MCHENHSATDLNQFIVLAIQYTMKIYSGDKFATWANRWISGDDRSESSAHDIEEAAALDWQKAETLSSEWRAAKAAWEVAWAARLSSMEYRERSVIAATRAIKFAGGIKWLNTN